MCVLALVEESKGDCSVTGRIDHHGVHHSVIEVMHRVETCLTNSISVDENASLFLECFDLCETWLIVYDPHSRARGMGRGVGRVRGRLGGMLGVR